MTSERYRVADDDYRNGATRPEDTYADQPFIKARLFPPSIRGAFPCPRPLARTGGLRHAVQQAGLCPAERFWSDHYIQHSAHIAPGRDGLFNLIRTLPDTLRYKNQLIVAEGDYVIAHGRFGKRTARWAPKISDRGAIHS
jgi:hypothetical protein